MAKTLIAFYSRRGQNYVDGSIRNLSKGNNEVIVEKHEGSGFGQSLRDLKAAIPSATIGKGLSIQGSKVKTAGKQIEEFVKGQK